MVEFNQDGRSLKSSLFDSDSLLLTSFEGQEKMSHPFRFSLDMISYDPSLELTGIVGQPVGFTTFHPGLNGERLFHGKVLRISAGQVETIDEKLIRRYSADVVPNFWFLKYTADCRVFQEKTIPDIVEQVLKDSGQASTDYALKLKGTYAKLDYCVQYNESDYHFVTRLLEEAGAYYYFTHGESAHQMVIADDASGYSACEENEVEVASKFGMNTPGQITKWERQVEFTSGKYLHTNYDFENPDTNLLASEKTIIKQPSSVKDYEVFEYPGRHLKTADGKAPAKARMIGLENPAYTFIGESSCSTFSPGGKFEVVSHPVEDEQSCEYTLTSVRHEAFEPTLVFREEALDSPPYRNEFISIPSKSRYVPPRITPKPRVHGLQSAKVVGAKNDEIHTDKYGRVRVQFHWDREGTYDDKSSCWVRVAQSWAGAKRGTLYTPRVGDEVVVDFLDGEIDRPIIVGSLYNSNNLPPFDPLDTTYSSGIKTLSTNKAKAKNFNELRFDDKIESELIYFHAERDFERVVENNDTLKVGFDVKDAGDQKIDIFNDRTVTLDKGADALTIKTGDRTVNIDKGNHVVTIKQGDQKIKVTAGKSSLEAGKEILLKVGGNSIKIDQQGITIAGVKVSVKADMKAEVKGTMVDVVGSGMTTIKGGIVKIN